MEGWIIYFSQNNLTMKTLFPFVLTLLGFLVLHAGNPDFIIVPFELHRNVIIVQAQVGDHQGSFILDTGVPLITLNSKYYTGIDNGETYYDIYGNKAKVSSTYIDLRLRDYYFKGKEAHVIDLEELENRLQRKILGFIGINAFRQCELVLDYVFQELTI